MKNLILGFAVVAMAAATSAFTEVKKVPSSLVENLWVFEGDTESQIQDADKYQQGISEPSGCGSGSLLPCTVNFPDEVTDESSLEDYLSTHSKGDVLARSISKRN